MGWGACQCSDHSSSPGNASHPSIHPYGHIIIHHEWTDCCWHSGSLHLPDSTCLHLLLWYRWQYVRQTGSHHPLCCIRCCCSYEAMWGGCTLIKPTPTHSQPQGHVQLHSAASYHSHEGVNSWVKGEGHSLICHHSNSFIPPPTLADWLLHGWKTVRERELLGHLQTISNKRCIMRRSEGSKAWTQLRSCENHEPGDGNIMQWRLQNYFLGVTTVIIIIIIIIIGVVNVSRSIGNGGLDAVFEESQGFIWGPCVVLVPVFGFDTLPMEDPPHFILFLIIWYTLTLSSSTNPSFSGLYVMMELLIFYGPNTIKFGLRLDTQWLRFHLL